MATKTSRLPRNLNFLGETAFFGGIFCLEYPSRRSEKVNCHFLNYRLSFRKLQIFISQTTDFHFVSFHFVSLHFVSQTTVSQLTVHLMLSGPTNAEHTYVQTVWQASTMVSCNKLTYLHHDNPDKPMYLHRELRLCIKVGRGHGDGNIETRVWGLGTWGRETRDLRTPSMGREDVKYRDAGCE